MLSGLLLGSGTKALAASPAPLPLPDHVVIVILENHSYDQIINVAAAPYINALANDLSSALFTVSFGTTHPSQPNYLDLYSGCNQNVWDDSRPATFFKTENLGHQLISAGKTFATYSEDLPSVGFDGNSSGAYARKHNPAANWVGTDTNQIPATVNQPFTAFPTDFTQLPTLSLVIPNLDNDMHDGTITVGDTWVKNNLDAYVQWAKTHNSLFILTFDEDNDLALNHIATIFSGQMVKKGKYNESINHYKVLRTIQNMYGLSYTCNSATTSTITDCWTVATGIRQNKQEESGFSVYPNPSKGDLTIISKGLTPGATQLFEVYDLCGKLVAQKKVEAGGNTTTTELQLQDLSPGIYMLKGTQGENTSFQKLIIQ